MKQFFSFLFILLSTLILGQVPANDLCSNAQAIALPTSGNICINSSNLNATSDNSTNTCDIGAAGNEVWFTYIATGANNVITVTPNGSTPASGMVVTLISSGCTSGVYDICNSATGSASVAATLGLTPGTQVLISVETNGSDGDFQLCINSTPPSSSPGDGCAQSTLVCDKSNISFPNLTGFTASGTSPSCFSGLFGPIPVRKDVWVKFTVGVTGTLEFTGTVLGASTEYDWALYNITSGCLGTEVSCDYDFSGATTTFGMSSTTPTAANFNAPITVTAGQTYALLVDNYSQNNVGFSLDWGGTFQMGTTAIFTVTPQSSCSVPVTVNITNGSVGATTYTWNYGDGSTSITNNATHTYTASGDYLISLIASGSGCTSVYSQRVNLNSGPVITISPATASVCPPSSANLGGIISLGTPYNDHIYTNNPNTAITNNTAAGITNTITSTGMINSPLTTGMVQSICFTINHTKHSDIGNDGLGNNVTITVNGNTYNFTPLPLPNVSGTATYCFPQSVLNAIMAAGGSANTPWVLKIADTRGGGGGTGSLVSWSVVLRDPNSVVSYSWSPTSTMTNSNTLNPTVSPTTTTIYTLTATDKFGCTSSKTATVSISCLCPTLTAVNYGGPVCNNSNTALTPTLTGTGVISGGTYSSTPAGLSLSASTGIITPSLSASNNYTVTYVVTPPSGTCTAVSISTVVVIKPTPTIAVTNTSVCDGSSVTLTAGGALSYTWSTGATTASVSVAPITLTIYTVTGTSSLSCINSNTVSVSVNPIPTTTASTTGTLTCSSTTVALNSTLAGMTYTWAAPAGGSVGSANTQSTTASGSPGTYTLFIKSAAGCTYTTTTSISQNTTVPTTTASTTGTLTCSTTTVALNSTLTGMSYTWTAPAGGSVGSANTQSTTASGAAGTFTVKVVDPSNGCTYTTTTAVTQNTTVPTTTASTAGTLTCITSTVALNSTLAGMNYTWTAPAGGSVGSANTQSTTASGAAGTYSLMVLNPANGCTYSTTTSVNQNTTAPTTTASTTGTLSCSTSTVGLNSTLAGMNYTWSAPAGGSVGSANTQSTTASGVAGTYSLLVVNPSTGCTFATTTSVTQNSVVPTTTASTTGTLTCSATTVALNSTLAGMNYTWTAPVGGSVGSANTQSTTASGAAGTYSLLVVNPSTGCTFVTTTSVSQNTAVPTTTAITTGSLTCSTTTVALSSTLAGMNYTWTAPAGGSVGSANTQSTTASGAAGTYTIKVVNPANGCIYTTTTSVTQNTIVPTTTASTTGTLTCSTTTVSLNSTLAGMNYAWTTPAGGSVASANTQSTSASGAVGTYTIKVVNPANGCTYTTTTIVTQNTIAPTGVNAGSNQTLTCATPSITLNGSVTTPTNATILWAGPNVCGIPTSYTTSACGAGQYTLTATNPINGCTATSTVQVSPSAGAPAVILNPVTNTITCTNTLVTVSVSSTVTPATYTWSGAGIVSGNGTGTITVNQGGTFNFTLTNTTNSCTTSNNQVVIQNTAVPTTTASTNGSLTCIPASTVTLNSTLAGMNYTWTAPAGGSLGSANTQTTSATGAIGVYTLTVKNPSNGCSFSTTTSVGQNTTVPTGLSAGSNQTLTCGSPSVTINGSVSSPTNATANWSGALVCGSNTSFISSACAAGIYTLTATNPANGCISTSTMQVFPVSGAPTVSVSPVTNSITCTNTLVTIGLSSTVTPVTYTWSGTGIIGATNASSINVSQGGTFTYTVTNSGGCSTVGTQTVAQNIAVPTSTASTTGSLTCSTITVNLNSTLAGMNYTWTAPAGGSVGSANTQSTTASGAAGTYTVKVADPSNGCTYTTTTAVTQNTTVPTTTASTTGTLTCATLTVALNSTLAGMNYTWSAPAGGSIGSVNTQSTVASVAAGNYSLTVMNPANGCSYSTAASVTQNTAVPTTTASTSGTITCATPTVILNSTVAGMTYTWTAPAGGNVSSVNTQSTSALGGGGTYSLSIINPANGCSYTTTTNVIKNTASPTITVSGTQTITCLAPTATLNATGGGTYIWSGPGITSGGSTASPVVNLQGTYIVTVTSGSNGCTSTATTSVIKNTPSPTITITGTPTLTCLSPTASLNASGGGTYAWSGPGIISGSNSPNPSVNQPGVYSLTVTNSNGCTTSTTTSVSQNTTMTSPMIISPDVIIAPGEQTNLSITGGGMTYAWSPSSGLSCTTCTNPVASPEETTQYCVTSTEGICSDTKCVNVIVEINCENTGDYSTPNAFSPNGDGNNDEFCLAGWKGCLSSFYVAIYNRWGNKVFESSEADFCWDGKYLGKLLDPAVFVFYIKAVTIKGDNIDKKGNITLIK